LSPNRSCYRYRRQDHGKKGRLWRAKL
jgi:hypothetical protein